MQSLSSQIYEYCGRSEARAHPTEPRSTMTNLCELYPAEAEILLFILAIMVSLMIAFGLPTFYIHFWGIIQKIKEDRQAKRIKRYYDLIQNRPRDDPVVAPSVPSPIQQAATPAQSVQTAVIEPMPRRVKWSEDYLRPPPTYERSLLMDGRRFGGFYPQSLRLEIPTDIYPERYQIPSRNYENVRLRDLTTPPLERAGECEPALPAPNAD